MFRTSEVSGVTERYSVNQNAIGTKSILLGADTAANRSTHLVDRQLILQVRNLVLDSLTSLSSILMRDSGVVTTGIQIDALHSHIAITWPKVDPPINAPPLLDSLYNLMLRVESKMITPQ